MKILNIDCTQLSLFYFFVGLASMIVCFIIGYITCKLNNMKWIKLDSENLPQHEVLAANFNKGTYGYKEKIIGFLEKQPDDTIVCENNHELLESCTHYVDLREFDISQ